MLNVNKVTLDGVTSVELSGTLEENVNLEDLIGAITGKLMIKAKMVTRMNSVGVKTWIRYFQSLKNKGVIFEFHEVSSAVIEQFNMISNFASGGKVVSLMLPFSCSKCAKEFGAVCLVEDLQKNNFSIPKLKCEKDPCLAQFDDDPEEYFYFLRE